MLHIGNLVKAKLKERAHTCVWLAAQMGCSRTNLYKIFNKKYVGSRDLEKLSLILNFNFFEVVSKEMKEDWQIEKKIKREVLGRELLRSGRHEFLFPVPLLC